MMNKNMYKDFYPFDDYTPDMVNEDGIKWWKIESATNKLLNYKIKVAAYHVLFPSGDKKRVLLDDKGVFFETSNLEDLAFKIDTLILLKQYEKK